MNRIDTLDALHALYGTPGATSLKKVARELTPTYRRWIETSKLCLLTTVGPEGTDGSPRGDDGPVVTELSPTRLAMPDWRGNNRLDSLRNIVSDGRISLMFMVPGSNNVVRLNGTAWLTDDAEMRARFERDSRQPAIVTIIEIGEIYFQCARALMRAEIWKGVNESEGLPTAGDFLAEVSKGEEGGAAYDADWPGRAAKTLW